MLSEVIRPVSLSRFLLLTVPMVLPSCATPVVTPEGRGSYLDGGEPLRSLNGQDLPPEGVSSVVRFAVCGHLYGDPAPWSTFPAESLTDNVARIESENLDLFVALGDAFKRYEEPYITSTKRVLYRLSMPVFNAPGNHDVTDRGAYTRDNGPTYGALAYRGCLLVVLDTEMGNGSITGQQLEFLREVVASAVGDPSIHSVFFFAHRLLFAQRARYASVAERVNDKESFQTGNFTDVVQSLLRRLVPTKGVYWFGGNIGVGDSPSLFFDRDPTTGITFVAAGIGDTDRDAYIVVEVLGPGLVEFTPVSTVGTKLGPMASYGIDTWR